MPSISRRFLILVCLVVVTMSPPHGAARPECLSQECPTSWASLNEDIRSRVMALGEDYKSYLSVARTELATVKETVRRARAAGFRELSANSGIAPGDRLYIVNRDRAMALVIVGDAPVAEGVRIAAAHIDSPRIELKAQPLYEREEFAQFQTNYHGGIKRYQWTNIPLALSGRVDLKDGRHVEIDVGLDPEDPVLIIPGLSPHVDTDLRERINRDVITAEEMDPIIGHMPLGVEEGAAAMVLAALAERYGIERDDFVSAELAVVPAMPPRDAGLSRSMVAAYGQDDRISGFASMRAALDLNGTPPKTVVVHLVDNEEVGNVNNTGAASTWLVDMIGELLYRQMGRDFRAIHLNRTLAASRVLSLDLNPGINPIWPDAWEPSNAPRLGHGVNIKRYGRGFDANTEYTAWFRSLLDENAIAWQTTTYKVGRAGGGTVGGEYARHNMDVIDVGVPVLSIHTPYAISSKVDLYWLTETARAFYQAQ